MRSMNGSRRNSGSSLVSSSSASSNLSHLEEDTWILWGRIANEWEEWRRRKEKLLKVGGLWGQGRLVSGWGRARSRAGGVPGGGWGGGRVDGAGLPDTPTCFPPVCSVTGWSTVALCAMRWLSQALWASGEAWTGPISEAQLDGPGEATLGLDPARSSAPPLTGLQELIRKGIPHHFRAIVWQLLCSATDMPVKNQYSELLKMSSPCEKLIRRDIARTYPEHEFFKGQDSLGQEVLFNVMKVSLGPGEMPRGCRPGGTPP